MRLSLFALLLFTPPLLAGTVAIDTTTLTEGRCETVSWPLEGGQELPVVLCRRTPGQLARLRSEAVPAGEPLLLRSMARFADLLVDSVIASQALAIGEELQEKGARSLRDEFLLVIPLEPNIGCLLTVEYADQGWLFRNPCHGNIFDSNGRPLDSSHLPFTTYPLRIPPHHYEGTRLIVGALAPQRRWHSYDFRPDFADELLSREQRLLLAARWGETALVGRLLDEGAKIDDNSASPTGATALLEAVGKRQLATVRLLLERGADPNLASRYGTSPLALARLLGSEELAALLTTFGAVEGEEGAAGGERP